MKKRVVWLLLSSLLVVILLGSCGPAATPTTPPATTPPTTTPPTTTPLTTTPPVGPEKPKYGGTINMVRVTAVVDFDEGYAFPWNTPALAFTNEELFGGDWAQGLSGSKKATWQTFGFSGLENAKPLLAESWEMPDSGTIIYHIRKGIKWHSKPPVNGREFTADDVVYTMKRGLELKTSYLAITLTADLQPLSITATDKYTVVVKVRPEAAGVWLEQSGELMVVIPPEVIQQYGNMRDWRTVVGTGAFTIKDYVPASALTLVKNSNYWRDDPLNPGNRLPYIDEIKMLIVEDQSTRLAALRTAKLDAYRGMTWEEAGNLKQTNPELLWARVLTTTPTLTFMNLNNAPFTDLRVRRALHMGVDLQKIAKEYYGGNAEVFCFPVLAYFPEHADMYVPLDKMPESVRELYTYNPDKAKKLLAEAGYPSGFKTNIIIPNTQAAVDITNIFKADWAKIGVDLDIQVKETAVHTSIITSKKYDQMTIRGLSGASTSHKLYTYRVGPVENLSFVTDPKPGEVYKQMSENYFDRAKRRQMFKDLVPYVLDQAWMIQWPAAYLYTAWWPWLKNYNGEQIIGYYDGYDNWPIYVWVDQGLKQKMVGRK